MSVNKLRFIDLLPHYDMDTIWSVERTWKRKIQYASMGRYGIYHILKSIDKSRLNNLNVMMPVYACSSIAKAIYKAGFIPVYYDIDIKDLNGDIESITRLYNDTNSSILILPSLYGNPADLETTQKYCQNKNIYLIDDAAQAFGATLNGKMVGTFGNAGLFSFSSGKPTLGHMGCYFWCQKTDYSIKRTKHSLYHRVAYYNFFYNRYADYNSSRMFRFKPLEYLRLLLYKILDISNDDICNFEIKLLANICEANINILKKRRSEFLKVFCENWNDSSYRIVAPIRGESNNNKIVIVAINQDKAKELLSFLKRKNIYATGGYKLLAEGKYPVAEKISKNVIEIHYTTNEDCLQKIRLACQEWNLIMK